MVMINYFRQYMWIPTFSRRKRYVPKNYIPGTPVLLRKINITYICRGTLLPRNILEDIFICSRTVLIIILFLYLLLTKAINVSLHNYLYKDLSTYGRQVLFDCHVIQILITRLKEQ